MTESQSKSLSKLQNCHVLILGGSSGIGFGVAEAAVEHGARVSIASSQQSKINHALSRLQSAYPDKTAQLHGYSCDLSHPQKLESNLDSLLQAASATAQIDHIVFTAGDAVKIAPLSDLSVDDILASGNVRFLGPLILAKLAPHYLSAGPKSSITLTGGTMSHRPLKNWSVQAAWGSGVEGIARGLAVDLAPIRVNLVSPGAVYTELFHGIPEQSIQAVLQGYREWTLIDKVGTPEEVAESYIYLMKSTFVTGTVINTDGGRAVK